MLRRWISPDGVSRRERVDLGRYSVEVGVWQRWIVLDQSTKLLLLLGA